MPSGIFLSFGHAIRGLVEVTSRERNMKVHVLAGTAVGLLGAEVALPVGARIALVLATMLVLAAEMGNSALEALVDLHTRETREEARRVKDSAAGAVLVLAVGAVLVALAVAAANLGAIRQALSLHGARFLLAVVALGPVAWLLFGARSAGVDRAATVLGALLVAFLGATASSAALSLAAAALFVLAAASAAFPQSQAGR